jgi:hypothetical protein
MVCDRMEFSDEVIVNAWMRARARCECMRQPHYHSLPHGKVLVWACWHSNVDSGWETHHMDGDPANISLENCEILCMECLGRV